MEKAVALLLLFGFVAGSTLPPTGSSGQTLRCRRCSQARSLSDCTSVVSCATDEECYMDQIITEQPSIVYNGGCRPKQVCARSGSFVGKKRQTTLIACSRCCSQGTDCNTNLCGIPSPSVGSGQCYSCSSDHGDQSSVTRPSDCNTLTTCQSDEVCYAGLNNIGGQPIYDYGCKSKLICRLLMDQQFAALRECEQNPQLCGDVRRSSTAVCHSCCGDGGCNYGSCIELNKRLYTLYKSGLFNLTTLSSA